MKQQNSLRWNLQNSQNFYQILVWILQRIRSRCYSLKRYYQRRIQLWSLDLPRASPYDQLFGELRWWEFRKELEVFSVFRSMQEESWRQAKIQRRAKLHRKSCWSVWRILQRGSFPNGKPLKSSISSKNSRVILFYNDFQNEERTS